MQRASEAWEDKTFFLRPTARCVVGKEQRSIHRNDAPNRMGRCGCSMPPGLLTVVPVPYARSVKNMARLRKNLVVSALCCIHCRRGCQKSIHLPAFLPLIPSCGVIGRAFSLAEPGYEGLEATWSSWKPHPFHHPPSTPSPFSRAERAHWRMTWQQRLARNARSPSAPPVEITVYGLSPVFAQALGLRVA